MRRATKEDYLLLARHIRGLPSCPNIIYYKEWTNWHEFLGNPHLDSYTQKQQLLEMAKNKEPRPNWKTRVGRALSEYQRSIHRSYDLVFARQIEKLAPQWFVDTANENKNLLLKLARNKKSRPGRTTKMGRALGNYACKGHGSYDPVFDRQIKKLAPQWFVKSSIENKKKLLEMARSNKPRPCWRTQIGRALISYCNESGNFDPVFDKQIKKAAPQWFVDTAAENKKKLLEMARDKEQRPVSMGRVLVSYTCKGHGSYDPVFNKQIRKLAPTWFR